MYKKLAEEYQAKFAAFAPTDVEEIFLKTHIALMLANLVVASEHLDLKIAMRGKNQ